ncbi:hypothetical protein EDD86DRAFT_187542, partial [Gorgonomyces haynaldii]
DEDTLDSPHLGGLRKFEALDNLLATRPQKEDLVRQNILKGEVSGLLSAAQEQLKKKMVEDNLKNRIAHRPNVDELRNNNILIEQNE